MKKIIKATIGPMPRPKPEGLFDPMPQVNVEYDDGSTELLFDFYPDELSFEEPELLGLTRTQAHQLYADKDFESLQSHD